MCSSANVSLTAAEYHLYIHYYVVDGNMFSTLITVTFVGTCNFITAAAEKDINPL